jgi:2-haloalkanoic acid dehalogenase type II
MKAVLFDFGGTLYDYGSLEPGDREALLAVARWSGIDAEESQLRRAYRDSMRSAFRKYLPLPYYRHRDLFRDAVAGMIESFGVEARTENLDRYRVMQWEGHGRDFVLREGVVDTLSRLRESGMHVGMVSNIDIDQLEHLLEIAGIAEYFDSLLSSEEAGSCKPDPAIFEQALSRAGCSADQALFVGDSLPADIAGANRVGIQSVLIWHRNDRQPDPDMPRPTHVIRRIPDLLEII